MVYYSYRVINLFFEYTLNFILNLNIVNFPAMLGFTGLYSSSYRHLYVNSSSRTLSVSSDVGDHHGPLPYVKVAVPFVFRIIHRPNKAFSFIYLSLVIPYPT